MSARLSQATLDAITAAVAAALASTSAPAQPQASAPAPEAPAFDPTGKVCVCGHTHKRAVVSALRDQLATRTACSIKACVSTSCGR